MADTQKSRADLIGLFPDNIIGSISPQDLRDFLVSVLGGYTSLQTITGIVAQSVTATPQLITGWTSNGLASGLTPDHTVDYITIDVDGSYDTLLKIDFSATANKTYYCAIYVDGGSGFADATIPKIKRKISSGGDVGSTSTGDVISLSAGDKVAAYVWSSDGGTSFTPEEATLKLKRVG